MPPRRGGVAEPAVTVEAADLAVTDDPELCIRAELIRELLRGLHGDLDPRGVQIEGARVVGQLNLDHVSTVSGLDLLRCALPDGITCRRAHLRYLILDGSLLTQLNAEGVRIAGSLFAKNASITSNNRNGTIRLYGAHIGGQLELDHTTITNTTGPALHADGLRMDNHLFMRDATVAGAGDLGAIRLLEAHIGGQADFKRTAITNATGPAIAADGLHIDSHLFMRDAAITGAGELGAIRLAGAHIGGADLRVTRLDNNSGPLVVMHDAQITGSLFPPSMVCLSGRIGVNRPACPDSDRTIAAHGLTYSTLRETSWRQWLHLLVHHTPAYRPQPFQQLATVERAAGHDNNARHILITQQDELRRRDPHALGNRLGRWRHWLWGWIGRYGYRAHRLVLALAVVLTLAATLGYAAGQIATRANHHAAERVPPANATTTTPGTPCATVELIGLGIDRGLPLSATGVRARCDLDTTTRWGQTITVALWILQALLWGLATLAIASYTGLVRKPT